MKEADIHLLLQRLGCVNASTRSNGWVESTCPFAPWAHKKGTDSSPSFGVSIAADDRSFYRCHACNARGPLRDLPRTLGYYRDVKPVAALIASGDVASLVRVASAGKAVAKAVDEDSLVDAYGVLVRRSLLPHNYTQQEPVDEKTLLPFRTRPSAVETWLNARGITTSIADAWGLGFDAYRQRVTIPIRDCEGSLRGRSGRAFVNQKPKFMHSKGFRRDLLLFGEHTAVKGGTGYLVEGFFDVIMLQHWGYAAVAVLGTSLSKVQQEKLSRFFQDMIVVFDGDPAGEKGTSGVHDTLRKCLPTRTVALPAGMDPDDLKDPVLRASYLGSPCRTAIAC